VTVTGEVISTAFRRVATNVAVVTTAGPGWVHGCTANVWAESADPPVLLVTLKRTSTTYQQVRNAGAFAVNLLAEGQSALARRFAGPEADRFGGTEYYNGVTGSPLLTSCLAHFDCRVLSGHPFGAYEIVVGSVEFADVTSDLAPLVFVDGEFAGVAPIGNRAQGSAP